MNRKLLSAIGIGAVLLLASCRTEAASMDAADYPQASRIVASDTVLGMTNFASNPTMRNVPIGLLSSVLNTNVFQVYNVKAYGAGGGEGTTDDTAAIQAAIDASLAGGTVYFPPGTYLVGALILTNNSRLVGPATLHSAGPDIGLSARGTNILVDGITLTGSNRVGMRFNFCTNATVRNCTIRSAILTNANGSLPQAAIQVGSSSDVLIEKNLLTSNGNVGTPHRSSFVILAGSDLGPVHRMRVNGNTMLGNNMGYGILLFDSAEGEAVGNNIDQGNVLCDAGASGYGITFYAITNGPNCHHNRVIGNHIRNTAGTGIYLQQSHDSVAQGNTLTNICQQQQVVSLLVAGIAASWTKNAIINDNVINGSGHDGVASALAITNNSVGILGNTIVGAANAGVHVAGNMGAATVTGNRIYQSPTYGILLSSARNASVSGNLIEQANYAIFSTGTEYSTVSGNMLVGSTNYGIYEASGYGSSYVGNNIRGNATAGAIDLRGTNSYSGANKASGAATGILLNGYGQLSDMDDMRSNSTPSGVVGASNVIVEHEQSGRLHLSGSGLMDGDFTANSFAGTSGQIYKSDDALLGLTFLRTNAHKWQLVGSGHQFALWENDGESTPIVVAPTNGGVGIYKQAAAGIAFDVAGTMRGTNVHLLGITNQVVFGATNTAPSTPATPTKWISVQVQGETTVYRLPLYE